jgi:histidinol-phosphate/aromatic aminotransferase/cobyric acid decarboxylase-like protein
VTRPSTLIDGVRAAEKMRTVRLHLNEAPWGPPPSAVRRAGSAARSLHLYPIDDTRRATELAGDYFSVAPERVILTTGVDEATDLCLLELGTLLTITPGFNGFKDRAAALDRPLAEFPLTAEWGLSDELLESAGPGQVAMLASPNNPVGWQFPERELLRLLNTGCHLLLDETYADFAPHAPGRGWLEDHERLLLFRSFSKSFGLGGLRVGCLLGDASLLARLRARQPYYPLDRLAAEALIAALEHDPDFPTCLAAQIEPLRDQLIAELRRSGLFDRVFDSAANFVLVTCADEQCARRVQSLLLEWAGILVASAAPFGVPAGLRISVGDQEALQSLADALCTIKGTC